RRPVAIGDLPIVTAAGDGGSAAVLLSGVEIIRKGLVGSNVIELAGGLVVPGAPGASAVKTDRRTLINADDHALRVQRIDPNHVIVIAAWRSGEGLEGAATIFRTVHRGLRHVHDLRIPGINKDAAEIAIADDARVGCCLRPILAAVVSAEQ